MFEGNPDVVFVDVNLRDSPTLRKEELGPPGKGGWPTIRYFNRDTGKHGASYNKVTALPMCQELLDRHNMINYVEGYSGTVLCGVDGKNCNERESTYLEKWKTKSSEEIQSQLDRIELLLSKPMQGDLMDWAIRRTRILNKIVAANDGGSDASSAGTDEL